VKKSLQAAVVEKDVENAYREAIHKGRPEATITSPYNTDGYAQWGVGSASVRLLLEAKYDLDFKSKAPVCNTLGQCLLYIKRFEQAGEPLPNVILVGDKNECFVLATATVKGFLDELIDWSVAPSTGDAVLTRALVDGFNLLPYVHDVDGNFKFRDILKEIESLAAGEQATVRATVSNLGTIFLYWRDRVFTGKDQTPVEQVDVFLRCLFQPKDVYPHPTKRGVLVVPGYPDGILINRDQYTSFFARFEQGYKPSEIDRFYSMKDRLVEDDARRRQGAFFTPRIWVDEANKYVSETLGSNWRQECLVWDPACGTGNLTRDYQFDDLILTTAEKPDVDVIKEQGYNQGAATLVQQYDFLNPGQWSPFFEEAKPNILSDAIVTKLREASKAGKRLVFLMNPPYGTANNAGAKGTHKAGIASTSVNKDMKAAKLGAPSQQLYAQFLFQCARLARDYGFKDHTVATFSIHTFMCSGSYKKFRDWWYSKHEFKTGFLFQASHFADVSGRWGVAFTVWNSPGKTDPKGTQPINLKDIESFAVQTTGVKAIYNSDGREASKWVREPLKRAKGEDAPQMSSGLKVKEKGRGSLVPGSLYFFGNNANNLCDSGALVYVVSSADTRNHGLSVLTSNWRRAIALFAARKLVQETWEIHQDEYLAPVYHTSDAEEWCRAYEAYEQWTNDCHIYALLHPSNNCTAMRDVSYKDGPPNGSKTWQIHNHFFWKTHADTLAALDTPDTLALYRDCQAHPSKDVFGNAVDSTPDPYMAHVLVGIAPQLSPDARAVLYLLDDLWTKSLPLRESYAAGKPELHLTAWDASIYQLKWLFRELFPVEWKELQGAWRALGNRLQDGVYDHGFLKR